MVMVTDSMDAPLGEFQGSYGTRRVPVGPSKFQIGQRTGPSHRDTRLLTAVEPAYRRAQTVKALGLLSQLNPESPGGRSVWTVNRRDYSESFDGPSVTVAKALIFNQTPSTQTGLTYFEGSLLPIEVGVSASIFTLASSSEESEYEAQASAMLRNSVPTAPEIDLLTFAAEQKDAPRMFRAANYIPRSRRDLGGAYLNYVFGVKPTVSDLQRISETVVRADPILKGYIANERKLVRRRSSRILGSSYSSSTSVWNASRVSGSITSGGLAGRWRYLTVGYPSSYYISTRFTTAYSYRKTLRSFGTWMYYIPRPQGFAGRLSVYRRQAERLLGGGFTASTAWELTRFSWLVDWFVDVGGLLRYQQAVANANVVGLRTGFTVREEATATLSWEMRSSSTSKVVSFNAPMAIRRERREIRRPGGPYAIVQPWNLTGSRAAVVTALGISRS